jgi:hypothetical protein
MIRVFRVVECIGRTASDQTIWMKSQPSKIHLLPTEISKHFFPEFWRRTWLWKMNQNFEFELQLESPSKEWESDYKDSIIFYKVSSKVVFGTIFQVKLRTWLSINSLLTCCWLWDIGDLQYVLKSNFVFSNFCTYRKFVRSWAEMKNRLLWWNMYGALFGSWNEVWWEVRGGFKMRMSFWNKKIDQSKFIKKNPIFIFHSTKFAKTTF